MLQKIKTFDICSFTVIFAYALPLVSATGYSIENVFISAFTMFAIVPSIEINVLFFQKPLT